MGTIITHTCDQCGATIPKATSFDCYADRKACEIKISFEVEGFEVPGMFSTEKSGLYCRQCGDRIVSKINSFLKNDDFNIQSMNDRDD